MSNFIIQGYANLENVNANNMDLFYATIPAQLSTYFPILSPSSGSICSGVGNIVNKYGQVGTSNTFNFTNGAIRFLDQATNLTTDVSIKACYANYTAASVTVTCPISITQYYVVAVLSFNTPIDPFTTSTSVIISPTAMTLAQIAAQITPSLYNPLFAITTTDAINYTIHLDNNCAFNYGYIIDNPFPDITDFAGVVTITGIGGLVINNGLEVNGITTQIGALNVSGITTLSNAAILQNTLSVTGSLTTKSPSNFFVDDGTSAIISLTRSTNARPAGSFILNSEQTIGGVVPGFSTLATIGLTGYAGSPILGASYDFGTRWYLTSAVAGDAPASTNPKALAIMGDLNIVQLFSVIDTGGNSWTLLCHSFSGSFPSDSFSIMGNSTYSFPAGGANTTIDLGAASIASSNATLGFFAVTSESELNSNLAQLSVNSTTGSKLLTILTDGVPGLGTADIQFQLIYH